jgi:hypothetical protein
VRGCAQNVGWPPFFLALCFGQVQWLRDSRRDSRALAPGGDGERRDAARGATAGEREARSSGVPGAKTQRVRSDPRQLRANGQTYDLNRKWPMAEGYRVPGGWVPEYGIRRNTGYSPPPSRAETFVSGRRVHFRPIFFELHRCHGAVALISDVGLGLARSDQDQPGSLCYGQINPPALTQSCDGDLLLFGDLVAA